MIPTTTHLIKRPYAELVDDILTSLVGGVVNEPIFFDVKTDLYPLARPALGVRGITGRLPPNGEAAAEGANHAFQANIDFEFEPDLNAIVWLEGGRHPADESLFFVDYLLPDADPPITDINVGSVARTLGEAVGREIATLYEQVNRAYLFGFVDTAEGKALDLVVAILGVERKTADFAVGLASFFRDPQVVGDITIPSGTGLLADKGAVGFETTQQRTLQRGQARIDVPIRAAVGFAGEAGRVEPAAITEMARPVAGIARVTNVEPTFLGDADESDAELRTRAKAALRAFGKATLAALDKAVRDNFATTLEIWDPDGPPARRAPVGTVTLLVEAEPERFPGLAGAVNRDRAAGVLATLIARYVFFRPKLVVSLAGGITGVGKQKVAEAVVAAVEAFAEPLSSGEPALAEGLLAAVKAVEDVEEARVVDVVTWRSDLTRAAPETLLDALLGFLDEGLPSEATARREALDRFLFDRRAGVPSGERIADRSLLQKADGSGPASDADLEAGDFRIAAEVEGEPWWVVADLTPADILLQEGGG